MTKEKELYATLCDNTRIGIIALADEIEPLELDDIYSGKILQENIP